MWIVSHVHLPPYSFLLIEQFCRNNNKILHTFCLINSMKYMYYDFRWQDIVKINVSGGNLDHNTDLDVLREKGGTELNIMLQHSLAGKVHILYLYNIVVVIVW